MWAASRAEKGKEIFSLKDARKKKKCCQKEQSPILKFFTKIHVSPEISIVGSLKFLFTFCHKGGVI